MRPTSFVLLIAVVGIATLAAAGAFPSGLQTGGTQTTQDTTAPSATLDDLNWIVGNWRGTRPDDSSVEETWGEPLGDAMVGTFRSVSREGKTRFYEFMAIEQTDAGLMLRLRHFNPGEGLTCWEEKDACLEWSLADARPGRVVFRREVDGQHGDLVMEQTEEKALRIAVDIFREGQKQTLTFDLTPHQP